MQATRFEYRFRLMIHALIFLLGFGVIPLLDTYTPGILDALNITSKSTWLVLTSLIARTHLLTFSAATTALLAVSVVFTGVAAWFRIWGSAYVGTGVVQSFTMHSTGIGGRGLLADGPYRRTRNPLYLAILLHTIGLAVLMPPVGAVFAIAAVWLFQFRVALAEELFLTAQYGQPYLNYKAAVPRFLPTPAPQIPAAGDKPHWLLAVVGEIYFIGVFLTLLLFGASFNATPLRRGILISIGVALIARAFLPRPGIEAQTASTA